MSPFEVGSASRHASLTDLVEELARLLPAQTPLQAFVAHNTLQAFEHLPFEAAVLEGARVFGGEPYMREAAFAEHLARGRILPVDLEEVVDAEPLDDEEPLFPGGPTRAAFRKARLHHLFELPRGAALTWNLLESSALHDWHATVDVGRRTSLALAAEQRFGPASERALARRTLVRLWDALARVAPNAAPATVGPRRRDQLLARHGIDTDLRVHPLLIRLCAAFLDQGVAYWPMPARERGFLAAVRGLYGLRLPSPDPSFRGLAREWRRQEREGWDAERTIEWALEGLEVSASQRALVLRATLLSLPGWAGMMRQFELRPDRAPVAPRPARLIDYLAVQLVLDRFTARHLLRLDAPADASFADLEAAQHAPPAGPDLELVFEAFVLAQALEVDLDVLEHETHARAWLDEVRAFDEFERRRLLHLAYERRHRVVVLDGIVAHRRLPAATPPTPRFQVVFCIDDRECSIRRQLEESFPEVETFGYAGFFGVAMAYQGMGDLRARPLCPVNVVPRHRVNERALRPDEEQAWLAARRRRGSVASSLSIGSKTMTRGGLLTPWLGLFAVVPLVARCLAPRFTARIAHRFQHAYNPPPPTRLSLLRRSDELDEDGRHLGYSFAEMAGVVETLVRTVSLGLDAPRLVLIVGHGSSSLNNPHEAAYDCGATGGQRGGPNARAFAAMANRAEVRELLRARGVHIPEGTWFLGGQHDTCDDSMRFFDLDLVPDALASELAHARHALSVACGLNAHERCRRFRSAPDRPSIEEALAHVEARAVDLAQPRPECGHATNAVAIVGRRRSTRGLFLDRRAFLVSYDPTADQDGARLERLLAAVVPVGAGINLQYWFSFVDPVRYGCGTKLPHNIVGLIGVMDGHSSDLRTGLPWQQVELHEPVRLLTIVEASRGTLERILERDAALAELVRNGWIQLVRWEPDTDVLEVFTRDGFRAYVPELARIPLVQHSPEFYAGHRESLGLARADAALHPIGGTK